MTLSINPIISTLELQYLHLLLLHLERVDLTERKRCIYRTTVVHRPRPNRVADGLPVAVDADNGNITERRDKETSCENREIDKSMTSAKHDVVITF
jgi:hypothetical protein